MPYFDIVISILAQDAVVAVLEEGMTGGLRSPFYNAQGERIAELIGGRARMQTPEAADVEHLRIDLFEGAQQLHNFIPRWPMRFNMVDG